MSTNEILLRIERRLDQLESLITESKDELLDVDGAARVLGVSRSAIYEKTCSKDEQPPELPHFKKGKRLFFSRHTLESIIRSRPVHSRDELQQMAANLNGGHAR